MKVQELEKPANTWCTHCDKGVGCRIYEARPQSCREYECLWLRSQAFDHPMPPALRPDRSHVVMGTINNGNDVILYVPPEHPDAWQTPTCAEAVGRFVSGGIAVYLSRNDIVKRIF